MFLQQSHAELVSACISRKDGGKPQKYTRWVTESALDRTQANTGTQDVSERLRFDEAALANWMSGHVSGFAGPVRVSQFKGGQSNPTYRIDSPSGCHVLRRKPPGKLLPGAHAVEREYRVLAALGAQGFAVPRVHA